MTTVLYQNSDHFRFSRLKVLIRAISTHEFLHNFYSLLSTESQKMQRQDFKFGN
jgi:hypothetical protein